MLSLRWACFLFLHSFLDTIIAQQECFLSENNRCSPDTLQRRQVNFVHPSNAVCSDPTIPYFFQVQPGDSSHIWIHWNGGSFCETPSECADIPASEPRPRRRGIFGDNDDNPVSSWTRIVILYCTGDAHLGTDTTNVHFGGYENALLTLDWVYEHYPDPQYVALSACSAGSLGLMYWSRSVLLQYPQSQATVLLDGWMGLENGLSQLGATTWGWCSNTVRNTLQWNNQEWEWCRSGQLTPERVLRATLQQLASVPFVFVNYKNDEVQRSFHLDTCSTTSFFQEQQELLVRYSRIADNAISFWLDGIGHCVLHKDDLYTEQTGSIQLVDWVDNVVHRRSDTVDSVCEDSVMNQDSLPCDQNLFPQSFSFSIPSSPGPTLSPTKVPLVSASPSDRLILSQAPSFARSQMPSNSEETTSTPSTVFSKIPSQAPSSTPLTTLPTQTPSTSPDAAVISMDPTASSSLSPTQPLVLETLSPSAVISKEVSSQSPSMSPTTSYPVQSPSATKPASLGSNEPSVSLPQPEMEITSSPNDSIPNATSIEPATATASSSAECVACFPLQWFNLLLASHSLL